MREAIVPHSMLLLLRENERDFESMRISSSKPCETRDEFCCFLLCQSASLYARLRSEQVHERAQRQCVISASRAFHAWACGIDSGSGAREAGQRYTLMWRRKRMLRRACAVWWGVVSRGHMIVYLRDKWSAAPRHSDRSVFSAWQRVTACEHRARAAKLRWLQGGAANSVVHAWRVAARRSAWIGARVERVKNARDRGGVEVRLRLALSPYRNVTHPCFLPPDSKTRHQLKFSLP